MHYHSEDGGRNKLMVNEVRMFWHGALSRICRLSLMSWVRHGYSCGLYTFDTQLEVPKGVTVHPANQVISRREFAGWGVTSISDLFRYRVLDRFGGWYSDL